jgi:pilus assembly protein Flp/PilA
MSDLNTHIRNLCIDVYVAMHSLADRSREERGQTAAEYMGVLLVVSAIIAAVVGMGLGDTIGDQAEKLIKRIGGFGE